VKGYENMSGKKVYTPEVAKKMGDEFGIKWDGFDEIQLADGMNVELEHGTIDTNTNVSSDDPLVTMKIALAHLNEFPDYYIRLEKMEEEAEAYWKNRKR
jgi:hypothetical protein